MTFYGALILQKTNIFCREILSQNVAKFYDERPKSIRTWSGLSEWKVTQPKSPRNRCA